MSEEEKYCIFIICDRIKFNKSKELPSNFRLKIADLGNACWIHHHFSTLI